jgi:hypothetical protein
MLGGPGFEGLIRENAGSGFCAGAAAPTGTGGLIREIADPRFDVGAARRWSGRLTHSRDPTLSAAADRSTLASRRCRGMSPRSGSEAMLLEGLYMWDGPGWNWLIGLYGLALSAVQTDVRLAVRVAMTRLDRPGPPAVGG